ncbi:MAG: DUF5522 domain-containing protein [Pyrinomonadaceae bacterium]
MRSIRKRETEEKNKREKFVEGVDFYFENGLMVLTAHFLRKRGYCCGNGCRHCPYPPKEEE